MTSDDKTLAFLARRVGALERQVTALQKQNAHLLDITDRTVTQQERWVPYFEEAHERLAVTLGAVLHVLKKVDTRLDLNERDHTAILKELGIEEPKA